MYFDNFEKVLYDFNIANKDQFLLVRDITKNVRFKKEFIDQLHLYETYKMSDGESIEVVSEKVYGTPEYHWILMLLNQRYDYIDDYPLSTSQLETMIDEAYGDRKNDVRHYIDPNGHITNATVGVTLQNTIVPGTDKRIFDYIVPGAVIRRKTAIGEYVGRIQSANTESKIATTLMTTGGFKPNDPVKIYKYTDDYQGNTTETLLGSSTVLDVTVPEGYTAVTNYEYEYFENEKKRIIKIVPQQYLEQILSEFDALMTR